ncbi:hypothetical protein D917_03747 [Trichinella nativa]|uniref:WD repeat-containing protein 75 second beta-propeller domain-containing protein n=1 Tax=Trichinella nativa TaxID=6335 RepID=A0A1Y3E6X2_9BILA|nr:hypothetical protein D917_03747 [Trichinella nativa]
MHDAEVSFVTVSDNLNKEFEVFTTTVDGFVNRWNWKDAVILTVGFMSLFDNKCFAFILKDTFGVIDLKGKQRRPIYHKHSAVLITGHPTEPILATGSSNGEISVWYRIFQHQLCCTTCHWHPYVINHLVIRGNSLLSGGQEQVLVKWDLRDLNGRNGKSFCARLHGAVKWITISPNSEMYAVCLDDNSVQMITPDMTKGFRFQYFIRRNYFESIASGDVGESPYPAGMLYSTFNFFSGISPHIVITNGRIGELQFYCPVMNKNVMNLDVIQAEMVPEQEQQNKNTAEELSIDDQLHKYLKERYVMSERTNCRIPFVDIASFAIMDDWLVTAQCCLNTDSNPRTKMKFFKYSSKTNEFCLNATSEYLSGFFVDKMKFMTYKLHSDCCSKCKQLAVGCLVRGRGVCIWVFDNVVGSWCMGTTISYRKLSANCFTCSEAHSIIAVGFRGTLTLWELQSLTLIKSIDVSSNSDWIRDIFFSLEFTSDVVMVTTFTKICAWSLTQYNCLWSINVSVTAICQNPINGAIAAFTDDKICVFRLHNLNPLLHAEYQNTMPVVEAVFLPSNEQSLDSHFGMICCLTSDQNKRIRLDNIGWYSYLFHMSPKDASTLSGRKLTETTRRNSAIAMPGCKVWIPQYITNYKPRPPAPNFWRLVHHEVFSRPQNYYGERENVGEMEDDDDEPEEQMNGF